MTVSLKAKNAYPCGCARHEAEAITRSRNGAAETVFHRLVGTHNPRVPHPNKQRPVRAWPTDTWPGKP